MNHLLKSLLLLGLCGAAACAVSNTEDAGGTSDALSTLVPDQIEDIGTFMPSSTKSVHYTGQRRYIGSRIHVAKGVKILSSLDIPTFGVAPVAAIADTSLHVLAREVGGSISGGEGHSVAFTDFVAPVEADYWLLWGEDTRHAFTLDVSYAMKRSAGVECHADNMCISESCAAGRCAKTKTFEHVGACIVGADCTSNSCVSAFCQPIPDGKACTDAQDCEHHTCSANACTCLRGGVPSDSPENCCGERIVATATGAMVCAD